MPNKVCNITWLNKCINKKVQSQHKETQMSYWVACVPGGKAMANWLAFLTAMWLNPRNLYALNPKSYYYSLQLTEIRASECLILILENKTHKKGLH